MRYGLAAGFGFICLLTSPLAQAQVSPETYRLRPYDVISISVYNESQVSPGGIPIEVLPDGRISAPFVGTVEVAGKTTAELESDLTTLYKARLHLVNPIVSVVIVKYRPIRAYVSGAVAAPGTFQDFRPGDTVFQLLSRAGGVSIDRRADIKRATLTRGTSKEVIPIDLDAMLFRGDRSQDYLLEDGDTLFVPQLENPVVNVQGAVNRPGTFEYPAVGEYRMTDAISLAQGGVRYLSKMSEILVFRRNPTNPNNPTVIKVNYVRLIKNHDFSQNIVLKPQDLVYVSETKTPDANQIGQILNTLFFVDRFFTGGLFGFKF